MVLDGSERVDEILKTAMPWDVMVGVARRAWATNENSIETVLEYNKQFKGKDHLTIPFVPDQELIERTINEKI
jgi:urocanate hydratase